jgi:hypothetical protein
MGAESIAAGTREFIKNFATLKNEAPAPFAAWGPAANRVNSWTHAPGEFRGKIPVDASMTPHMIPASLIQSG